MEDPAPDVVILERRIDTAELRRLGMRFEDMVKYVVDVDAGSSRSAARCTPMPRPVLLEAGSQQADLWGANYYPGRGREGCIEYTSLINIRPAPGNRAMELLDPGLRARVHEITFALIGEGEPPVMATQHAGLSPDRFARFSEASSS